MPAIADHDLLAEMPLFHGLTPEQLARVNGLLHRKRFPAGATILTVEQPGEAAYVILSGTVKIHVEQPDGTDVILAILGPGEIVGEMSLLDGQGRSATAVTQEESMLVWLDRATFWDCLRTMPAMTYNIVGILCRRLRVAGMHIQSLARLDVDGRVAREILSFAEEYGRPPGSPSLAERSKLPGAANVVAGPHGKAGDSGTAAANGATSGKTAGDAKAPGTAGIEIPIRLTQSDLADLVGASRVRVNQVLVDYKRRRYISVGSNHHIIVHNPDALAKRAA